MFKSILSSAKKLAAPVLGAATSGSTGGWGAQIGGALLGGIASDIGASRGASRDIAGQKEMFDYRIQQGLDHGMTPYEMFTGGAAGAGGGSTGQSQTLGNAWSQSAQQLAGMQQETREREKDRSTQLAQTAMQTEAQKDVAKLNNETTVRGQDISAQQFQEQLKFSMRQYEETTLPAAAAALGKTEQETAKLINEVSTSTPQFLRMMKIMTMGLDNTIGLAIQNELGIDVSDVNQMKSLPPEKRRKLFAGLLQAKSRLATEAAGVSTTAMQWLDAMESILGIDYDPNAPDPAPQDSTRGGPTMGRRHTGRRQYFGLQ